MKCLVKFSILTFLLFGCRVYQTEILVSDTVQLRQETEMQRYKNFKNPYYRVKIHETSKKGSKTLFYNRIIDYSEDSIRFFKPVKSQYLEIDPIYPEAYVAYTESLKKQEIIEIRKVHPASTITASVLLAAAGFILIGLTFFVIGGSTLN